jgi:hypothetical protein
LIINRRTCNVSHPKLKEIIHNGFYDFTTIEDQLKDYNACFFCLGTTSVGKNEEEYTRITFELTKAFADTLAMSRRDGVSTDQLNPDMVFCYVSGAGTDSTEKGKIMWARVKGRTENYLLNLGFKKAYMFRPGIILPTKGLKNTLPLYKIFFPLLPIVKLLLPKQVCSLKEIGIAMINTVTQPKADEPQAQKLYEKNVLEVEDIVKLGKR